MDADETLDVSSAMRTATRAYGPRSDDQRFAEDHELSPSLAALSRLGSNRMGPEDHLTCVATYACGRFRAPTVLV